MRWSRGGGPEGQRQHLKEAAHGAGIPTRAHSHSPEIMTSAQIEPMSHGGAPRKIPPKKGYKLALNWQGWLGASGKGGSCRWSTVLGALRPRQDGRGLRPRPPRAQVPQAGASWAVPELPALLAGCPRSAHTAAPVDRWARTPACGGRGWTEPAAQGTHHLPPAHGRTVARARSAGPAPGQHCARPSVPPAPS